LTQDGVDYLRDLYGEEILSVDYLIGRFLNSLDNETLGCSRPLIMRIPGWQGKRIKGLAGLTDIMPTLLELLVVSDPAPV